MINYTGFLAAGGPLSALGQPRDLISFVVMCPLENIAPPPEGIQTVCDFNPPRLLHAATASVSPVLIRPLGSM